MGVGQSGVARSPTARQLEVGALICCGYQNKEISRQLGIGLQTVKRHVGELYRRLGVSSRAGLVGLLLTRNLVDCGRVGEALEARAVEQMRITTCKGE